jgi:dTMP kinase
LSFEFMSGYGTSAPRSHFITFEGIDGSGKSTQMRLLAAELRGRGFDVVTTREPGGTPLGTRLRSLLLDTETVVDPLAELLLYAADRAQHVRTLIRPALAANKIVLSDRYADATIAYQGAGRALEPELIEQVVELATGGLMPDLTLLFDLDVAEGHARRAHRRERAQIEGHGGDRLDNENTEFHTRVQAAYTAIARRAPARVRVIDARLSIEEIHARVMEIVLPAIGGQKSKV